MVALYGLLPDRLLDRLLDRVKNGVERNRSLH